MSKRFAATCFTMALFIPISICVHASAEAPSATRTPPKDLRSYFTPPKKYAGELGDVRSPLMFEDGTRVMSAKDWPRRRAEIVATWCGAMGHWPPMIERPRIEHIATTRRDNITQQQLKIGVALGGQMVNAFVLTPDGPGPFPAVIAVYYDAQTGAGLGKSHRDFAWQLARRGFVTLSIGKPNTGVNFEDPDAIPGWRSPYYGPIGGPIAVQPLSALAYAAANAHAVLARRPEVDANRIGIVGHSFGGKWAMFASCLYEKFACAAWSDPGIVFDERDRRKENPGGSVNYWDPWYLGAQLGKIVVAEKTYRFGPIPGPERQRTGTYKRLIAQRRDLVALHALMAPRPFLVSGGTADMPERWRALNHSIAVNRLLGHEHRVAMTNRSEHSPSDASNQQIYRFFEWWLK